MLQSNISMSNIGVDWWGNNWTAFSCICGDTPLQLRKTNCHGGLFIWNSLSSPLPETMKMYIEY